MDSTETVHEYIVQVGNDTTVFDTEWVSARNANEAAENATSGKWKGAKALEIYRLVPEFQTVAKVTLK